jgi:hypothetical protein
VFASLCLSICAEIIIVIAKCFVLHLLYALSARIVWYSRYWC